MLPIKEPSPQAVSRLRFRLVVPGLTSFVAIEIVLIAEDCRLFSSIASRVSATFCGPRYCWVRFVPVLVGISPPNPLRLLRAISASGVKW